MKRGDGPLWVRCHDLCGWLFERIAGWPAPAAELIGRPLFAAATAVWCAVARARAFKHDRRLHLRAADEALADVRTLAALAPLDAAGALHLGGETAAIGRMIGAWRKKLGPRDAASRMSST